MPFNHYLLIAVLALVPVTVAQEPSDQVVLVQDADLRIEQKIVDTLTRGSIVRVEKVNGEWLWVRGDEDAPGWLNDRYVLSLEEGLRHFNDSIRKNVDDTGAYYASGHLAYQLDQYDLALKRFTEYVSRRPNSASAYIFRGLAWERKSGFDKAIADYSRAIELDPKDVVAYNNRGNAWQAKGRNDQAIDDFDRAIAINSNYGLAYYNRGEAWNSLGEYKKAVADFNRAIRFGSKHANVYYERGCAHRSMGHFDRAIEDFTESIDLENANNSRNAVSLASSYALRALVWAQKGEWDSVIEDADQAIKLAGQFRANDGVNDPLTQPMDVISFVCYFLRARGAIVDNDFDAVIEDTTSAIRLLNRKGNGKPTETHKLLSSAGTEWKQELHEVVAGELYYLRALALIEKSRFRQAADDLGRAIEFGERDTIALAVRGYCKFQLQQHDAAIEDFTEAIRRDPEFVWALAKRAEVWDALEERQRASADRRKAAALDPEYARAELERLGAGGLLNRLEKAFPQGITERNDPTAKTNGRLAEFNAALSKDPENDQLYVSRGLVWARLGNDGKAIADFTMAIELNPDNAQAYADRGMARSRQGKFVAASRDLFRAMKLNSELRPRLMAVEAGMEFRQGRFENAQRALELSLDLDPNLHTTHHDLALQLVTCPDPNFRDAEKAIHHATRACELTDWNHSNCLEIRAAAYAENGDFDKAVHWQEKAIELANVNFDPVQAADRLATYKTERQSQLKHNRKAVVELMVPADIATAINVKVDGRDRGQQRKFTFPDIPHRGTATTLIESTLTDDHRTKIGRKLELKAGQRVAIPSVINAAMSQPLPGHHRVHSVAFSPDGKKLLIGAEDAAFLFDSQDRSPLRQLPAVEGKVRGVAFSPNGQMALIATAKEARLVDLNTDEVLHSIPIDGVSPPSVAFGPAGDWFLTNQGRNSAVIWDPETGEQLKVVTTGMLMSYAAAVDPNGRWLMLDATPQEHGMVWSLQRDNNTVADAYRETLTSLFADHYLAGGHRRAITSAAFSPDGKLVVTGGMDGKAVVWALGFRGAKQTVRDKEVTAPLQLRTLEGHRDRLKSVAFSSDGRQILTASSSQIILWDLKSGEPLGTFNAELADSHDSASISPDGQFIALADSGGVTFFDVATSECVAGLAISQKDNGWAFVDSYGRLVCPQPWWDHWKEQKQEPEGRVWSGIDTANWMISRDEDSESTALPFAPEPDTAWSFRLRTDVWMQHLKVRVADRLNEQLTLAHEHLAEKQRTDAKLLQIVQSIFWAFPEIVPARSSDASAFEKIVMNEHLQKFDGFRFRTPASDVSWNLDWEFVVPADSSMQFWYILPAKGTMQGFRQIDRKTENIQVPGAELPEKNVHYGQSLHGGNLAPDREYLIWFDFAKAEPSEVYIKLWLTPVDSVDVPPIAVDETEVDPPPTELTDAARFDPEKHDQALVIFRTRQDQYLSFRENGLALYDGEPRRQEIFSVDVRHFDRESGFTSITLRSVDGSSVQLDGGQDDSLVYLLANPKQKEAGGYFLLDDSGLSSDDKSSQLFGDGKAGDDDKGQPEDSMLVLYVRDEGLTSLPLSKLKTDSKLQRKVQKSPLAIYVVSSLPGQ